MILNLILLWVGPVTSSVWFSGSARFEANSNSCYLRVLFGLKTTSHGKSVLKNLYFEVRPTIRSGFQAKMLNTRGEHELELATNQAEPENWAELVYLALTLTK